MRTLTEDDWRAEGARRFGADSNAWRFVCPCCGHIATPAEWKAAGAPENAIAFSCVGRWMPGHVSEAFARKKGGPCNYAGGGLFKLNPVTVRRDDDAFDVFEFAEAA